MSRKPIAARRRPALWRSVAWISAGIVGLAALIMALAIFAPTPKRVFLMANYRWLKGAQFETSRALRTLAQVLQRTAKSPSVTNLTLTGGLDLSDGGEGLAQVQDLLRGTSLSLVAQQDPAAKKVEAGLKLDMAGTELFSANLFASPDQVALKSPLLDPRYLLVENHDLKATFAKIGYPYTGPDRLELFQQGQTVTAQDVEALLQDYGLYLTNSIHDDEFTIEHGVSFTPPRGGAPVKLDRVTLHLTESRIKAILKGLGSKLQSDEKLHSLLAAGAASSKAFGQAAAGTAPSVSDILKESADLWSQGVDSLSLPGGLTVELLVDKGDRLVKETITTSLAENGKTDRFQLVLTDWVTAAGRDQVLSFVAGNPDEEVKFEGSTKTEIRSSDETHTLGSYVLTLTDKGKQSMVLSLSGETTDARVDGGAKDRVARDYYLLADDGAGPVRAELHLTTYGTARADGDRYDNNVDVEVVADDGQTQATISLHGDLAVDFSKAPQFPDLTGPDVFNLTTASEDEIQGLLDDLSGTLLGSPLFKLPK